MSIEKIPKIINFPSFIESFEIRGEASWKNMLNDSHRTDLFLVQEGRGECLIDEMIVSVSAGDVVIVAPEKDFEIISSPQALLKGIVISCKNLCVSELPNGYIIPPNSHPVISLEKDFSVVSRYFSEIHLESRNPTFGWEDIIQSLMKAILIILLRKYYHIERNEPTSIAMTVKSYIEENFNQNLTLSELAKHVYVSPYHLAHIFKDEVGISPIQYLIQCRMEEAKRLLKSTSLSIREIASKVGYPNAIYFNLVFKKIVGVPPGKFRKKNRMEKENV